MAFAFKCNSVNSASFVIDSPQMMAQSQAESTRDTCNYGQYLNQFPLNTIKVIREFGRTQKKICRHKMSIMFNEICINEEMLPKYTYIHIYIYIYIYINYLISTLNSVVNNIDIDQTLYSKAFRKKSTNNHSSGYDFYSLSYIGYHNMV